MFYVISQTWLCLLAALLLGALFVWFLKRTLSGLALRSELPDLRRYAVKSDIPKLPDLSGYALRSELPQVPDVSRYAVKSDIPKLPDLSGYALRSELPQVPDVSRYAVKSDIPKLPDLSGYALKSELPQIPDVSRYAVKSDIPKLPDLSGYALKSELPDVSGYIPARELEAQLQQREANIAQLQASLAGEVSLRAREVARLEKLIEELRAKPAPPTAPKPDNLQRIRGVGPVLARRLNDLGVFTFRQIADWTDPDIDRMDAEIDSVPGRIRREEWVAQARSFHEERHP